MRARIYGSVTMALLCAPIGAQTTTRASVDSAGRQGDDLSLLTFDNRVISADGRYVAFVSYATNLVPGDTNGIDDIFVRDRVSGTTERVSVASSGLQSNGPSDRPSISADGRYVAFESQATNLVPGDTNGFTDVFVHDRLSGVTERVSVASSGLQGDGNSVGANLSSDGRYVVFASHATNLVPGDTNGTDDVFVRDRVSGTTERVSVDSAGQEGNAGSDVASISSDGRYVAFDSFASNLVAGDTNSSRDVFVHDRQSGATERVSVSSSGAQGIGGDSDLPSISADGRCVAFASYATGLVANDSNGTWDIFVHDPGSGTTERVSVDSAGAQGDSASDAPSISADGRYVAFWGYATNLVPGDTNGVADVFVHDRLNGTTELASLDSAGLHGNSDSMVPSISADGQCVAFFSFATNLCLGDSNTTGDIFVHERIPSVFANPCDPGSVGVIACPCANPASGPGRGCDNSSATGGAALRGSGLATLSADSLVVTTSGERPTSTSILLQATAANPSGVVFGQGVRCTAGIHKRLYTKTAVAGSILAPDFGAGDPTVSARSAALGDTILAGQSRRYLVYYRDPIVLGGCPASSTFNATQTVSITWWP